PERVYRCDEERDALASHQGSAVVHEAWVGTRTRRWGTPRWVTADAGLALPHGRSVFGRWYLSNLLSGERPGPPQPLTLPPPHPDRNAIHAIVAEQRAGGSFLAAVAGRLAALAALGLLIFWFS
ncbi:MAG TPA: hypothetical protein VFR35_10220, partial [Actinoplanes sp.]|nr:hypothetical protein [Actinoplanes sp.]